MKILIGSKNKVKIDGAQEAFESYFNNVEIIGVPVESDVSRQPVNEEIFIGAENRVKNLKKYAKENNLEADFYVSVESGLIEMYGKPMILSGAIIESKDGRVSHGTCSGFPVPKRYIEEIKGNDLSFVMDKLFNQIGSGQKGGGIAALTKNQIQRKDLCRDAFIMALTCFLNEDIWKD